MKAMREERSEMAKGEKNWPEPMAWPASSRWSLPGIEPVSACWPMTQSGAELGNDVDHDSPELTSMDPKVCAKMCPPVPRSTSHIRSPHAAIPIGDPPPALLVAE